MKKINVESGYFESFDKTKLYYETHGSGEPLIFLYGIGCLFNHWIHQVKYFSNTHKVILVDYRAHNKSDTPENYKNLNMEAFANDIKKLTDHLDIDKASFVAHSFGAQVLMKTYDIFPEMFDKIIFVNGFISNPLRGMFGGDLPSKFFHYFKKGYDILPETLGVVWKTAVSNPLAAPLSALAGGFNLNLTQYKDIEIYTKAISSIDLKAFLEIFSQMVEYDGSTVLKRIKVPVLIISGEKDNVTPLRFQKSIHRSIPHSEFVVMPYGTHCTQLDLPVFVNLRIEKFLKKKA